LSGEAEQADEQEVHHLHALGQGRLKFKNAEAAPSSGIRALMQRRPFSRRKCSEYYSLPAAVKVTHSVLICITA